MGAPFKQSVAFRAKEKAEQLCRIGLLHRFGDPFFFSSAKICHTTFVRHEKTTEHSDHRNARNGQILACRVITA